MRKIHLYLNDIDREAFIQPTPELFESVLDDMQRSIRSDFYPSVSRPFRPLLIEKDIMHADVAIFFLGAHDTSSIREVYYQAYVRGIPVFLIAASERGGDLVFREEIFSRHPHLITESHPALLSTLREYLLDFFHRELKKLFIPRYSQVESDSLLDGYRRDWEVFLPPPEMDRAREILTRHNLLIVYGPPHHGKSCMARNIMREYRDRGYRMNEIFSPVFTPQLLITVMKQHSRVVTILDTDSYPGEWTWQISAAIFRMVFASIEKWVDAAHPFIIIASNRKIISIIERFLSEGWDFLSRVSLEISPRLLTAAELDAVVTRHLVYYRVPANAHHSINHLVHSLCRVPVSPSVVYFLLRYFILPQGPATVLKLKGIDDQFLLPRGLFRFYLRGATMKELLLLNLVSAAELEMDTDALENLVRMIYQYSLFMEGKIVDLEPQQQPWIRALLEDLGGAVIRFYDYDRERRFVLASETIRTTLSKLIRLNSQQSGHRIITEAIVELLLMQSGNVGKYFAVRFLFEHYRAFSAEFRKKMLYHLISEDDADIRAYVVKQMFRFYYLIGREGFEILFSLTHDSNPQVRSEVARYCGRNFVFLKKDRDRFIDQIVQDADVVVRSSFFESLTMNYPIDGEGYRLIEAVIAAAEDEVLAGIAFGLMMNYPALETSHKRLLESVLSHPGPATHNAVARAVAYLPHHLVVSEFSATLLSLINIEDPNIRSLAVQALGGDLTHTPEVLVTALLARASDDSPIVRRDIAYVLIKNISFLGAKAFDILLDMVNEQRPYLRAAISSVIIEYFSLFSPEQQAIFLKQFLQLETIEGVRKSVATLISSHFHLLKPDTEEMYFSLSEHSSSEFRANLAEQILSYYPQLRARTQRLLHRLVEDDSDRVRIRLASVLHLYCSALPQKQARHLVRELANDSSEFVRATIALHIAEVSSCLSPFQMQQLLQKMRHDTEIVRSNLGRSLIESFSLFGKDHRELLDVLKVDMHAQVRKAILEATHTHFSALPDAIALDLLSTLAGDDDEDIRFDTFKAIIELAPTFNEQSRTQLLPLLTKQELIDTPLTRELETAAEIQRNLLPTKLPRLEGYGFSYMFAPARMIGGDFLGFFPLNGNRLGIALADISGKGIPAALLMANLQAWLKAIIALDPDPIVVCNKLNNVFKESTAASRFVSLVYGTLDRESGSFRYVNAGHNYPLLFRGDGSVHTLETGGIVMGIFADTHYGSETVSIEPGDRLVFYTDGVTESRNEEGEEFGEERFIKIIQENRKLSPKQLINEIERQLQIFSNLLAPHDDISIVVIQRFERR